MLKNRVIKILVGLRTIFFGTMLLVSFDVAFFPSDWFILVNLFLFSISNGYTSTLCAVKAPQAVQGEAQG